MPTYDYACTGCAHRFEHFQPITRAPLRKCPACGQRTLQRLIGTGGGIIFKGSGFYQTDYRSESYKKSAEAEKSSTSTSPESKPETPAKSTDQPAAKPEKKQKPSKLAS